MKMHCKLIVLPKEPQQKVKKGTVHNQKVLYK